MFYRTFSMLLVVSLLFILTSCHKNNKIIPSDKPIYLRGMLVHWLERMRKQNSTELASSPAESWFTLANVKKMKQAGANCLEIHQIGLPELMSERNVPNESFFTKWVDVWVDWCTQNQMYCILNIMGIDGRADWAYYLSLPPWLWEGITATPGATNRAACDSIVRDFFNLDVAKQDANRAAFINLWKFIAKRYKDNPYVIFSIMNEPFWEVNIPDEVTAIHLGQSYSKFMEQIVDGIQSTGATQKVFIDLPFLWDSNWHNTVKPVNRDNIVWEVHAYGDIWKPNNETFKAIVNSFVQLFVYDYKKPVFIGEYGITSIRENTGANCKSIISGQVAYLDSMPLIGRQYNTWADGSFKGQSDLTVEECEWIMKTVFRDK